MRNHNLIKQSSLAQGAAVGQSEGAHPGARMTVRTPGLSLKPTKSETQKLRPRNMKFQQASCLILNFKNPLGKGTEKILKGSEKIFTLKCASFYLFGLFTEDIFSEA